MCQERSTTAHQVGGKKHVDVSKNLKTLIFGSMNDQAHLTAIGKVHGGMPQVCFLKLAQASKYISNPKVSLADLPISAAAKPATASPGKSPNQLPIAHGPTAAWQYRDNCRSTAGSTTGSTAAFLPAAAAASKIPRLSARYHLILVAGTYPQRCFTPKFDDEPEFWLQAPADPYGRYHAARYQRHGEWPSVRLT